MTVSLREFTPVPDMTYTVFDGTLSLTQSINQCVSSPGSSDKCGTKATDLGRVFSKAAM